MSDYLTQPTLKRLTGSKDPDKQANWLRFNYGLRIIPASDGTLLVDKELMRRVQLVETSEDEFEMNYHGASKKA